MELDQLKIGRSRLKPDSHSLRGKIQVLHHVDGTIIPEIIGMVPATSDFECPGRIGFDLGGNHLLQRNCDLHGPGRFVFRLTDVPVWVPTETSRAAFPNPASVINHETVDGSVIAVDIENQLNAITSRNVGIPGAGLGARIVVLPFNFLATDTHVQEFIVVGKQDQVRLGFLY